MNKLVFSFLLLISSAFGLFAQSTFTIDASQPGIAVSPRLYGIFFEEINHAGEGGLYAEMVQNRDFEITFNQQVVVPQTSTEVFEKNAVNKEFPANSLTIIRVKTINGIK